MFTLFIGKFDSSEGYREKDQENEITKHALIISRMLHAQPEKKDQLLQYWQTHSTELSTVNLEPLLPLLECTFLFATHISFCCNSFVFIG